MTTLNTGMVLLNESRMTNEDRIAFCVLGRPRGGTTMAARLLEASGVFMGENMPVTAEDPAFVGLLKEAAPNPKVFDDLVAQRNAKHPKWGFKAPYRHHWQLLDRISNVRFLVVFRDVLAVANRNRISANADILSSMLANIEMEKKIVDYISASGRPALLFSYEKALISPNEISEALLDFVGEERTAVKRARLRHVVQPNETAYVVAQDLSQFDVALLVDVITAERVAGWARWSNGESVMLAFEVNGEPIATQRAENPRPDLAQRFGREGRFAFEVMLPPNRRLCEGDELMIRNATDNRPLFRTRYSD